MERTKGPPIDLCTPGLYFTSLQIVPYYQLVSASYLDMTITIMNWSLFAYFLGISLMFIWYDQAPQCQMEIVDFVQRWCKDDILYFWSPLLGSILLTLLMISLHNWVLLLHVAKSMKEKLNPEPFVRIGSRIVLGLEHTSHRGDSTQFSTLSKSSTLFSYGYI